MSKIYSQRLLFTLIILFFLIFLILPITVLLGRSIVADGQLSLNYYYKVLSDNTIMKSLFNSMKISLLAATTTTVLAFLWHIPFT
ncbi:hypothetical protein P6439_12470 [Staphylococcus arlettae]|nr:hypothetical protein [Staphylococcus arlettae]